jgi:hypothetical protein
MTMLSSFSTFIKMRQEPSQFDRNQDDDDIDLIDNLTDIEVISKL